MALSVVLEVPYAIEVALTVTVGCGLLPNPESKIDCVVV